MTLLEGISQEERKVPPFERGYATLGGRRGAERLKQLRRLCAEVGFPGLLPDGDEEALERLLERILETPEKAPALQPHLQLLLVFLRLMGHADRRFEALLEEHRDFYYRRVLRLTPRPFQPDRAFVAFPPPEPGTRPLLPEGFALTAGEDAEGAPLLYTLEQETSLGQEEIARLYRYTDTEDGPAVADLLEQTVFDPFREESDTAPYAPEKGDPRAGCGAPPPFDGATTPPALLIGVLRMESGGDLSLLFTLEPRPAATALSVTWSYLARSDGEKAVTKPLPEGSFSDGTDNLTESGILRITPLPADMMERAAGPGEPAVRWLVVTTDGEHANEFPRVRSIHPRAATARYAGEESDPPHLIAPLPAGSIQGPLSPDAPVDQAIQPLPSFGGRPAESDEAFHRRISERIGHRNRAQNLDDYQLLVLERFPEVEKVKCIPAVGIDGDGTLTEAGGHVSVVVIPDREHRISEPFEGPQGDYGLLREVEAYLRRLTPPCAAVHVVNPCYEKVACQLKVLLKPGSSLSFGKEEVATELDRLLSPWAFDERLSPRFVNTFDGGAIVSAIANLPFVEQVIVFRFHTLRHATGDPVPLEREYAVAATRPDAILISDRGRHDIHVQPAGPNPGIGSMLVGIDFFVTPSRT